MSIEQSVFKLQRLVRFSSVGVGTAIRALNTGLHSVCIFVITLTKCGYCYSYSVGKLIWTNNNWHESSQQSIHAVAFLQNHSISTRGGRFHILSPRAPARIRVTNESMMYTNERPRTCAIARRSMNSSSLSLSASLTAALLLQALDHAACSCVSPIGLSRCHI